MIVGGQLHQSCPRNALGHVPARLDRRDLIALGVDDQDRDPYRRQRLADIDIRIHLKESARVCRAGAHLLEGSPPPDQLWAVALAGCIPVGVVAAAPVGLDPVLQAIRLLVRSPPGVARTLPPARVAAYHHQCGGALRIGRSKQRRHHPSLGHAHHGGSLGADRIQHRADVIHTLLEGGQIEDSIREAGAALVEQDQA